MLRFVRQRTLLTGSVLVDIRYSNIRVPLGPSLDRPFPLRLLLSRL